MRKKIRQWRKQGAWTWMHRPQSLGYEQILGTRENNWNHCHQISYFWLQWTKFYFGWGSAQDPAKRAHSALAPSILRLTTVWGIKEKIFELSVSLLFHAVIILTVLTIFVFCWFFCVLCCISFFVIKGLSVQLL